MGRKEQGGASLKRKKKESGEAMSSGSSGSSSCGHGANSAVEHRSHCSHRLGHRQRKTTLTDFTLTIANSFRRAVFFKFYQRSPCHRSLTVFRCERGDRVQWNPPIHFLEGVVYALSRHGRFLGSFNIHIRDLGGGNAIVFPSADFGLCRRN